MGNAATTILDGPSNCHQSLPRANCHGVQPNILRDGDLLVVDSCIAAIGDALVIRSNALPRCMQCDSQFPTTDPDHLALLHTQFLQRLA